MEDLQRILDFVQKIISYFENFPFTAKELLLMAAASIIGAFLCFALLMRWVLGISKIHRRLQNIEQLLNADKK